MDRNRVAPNGGPHFYKDVFNLFFTDFCSKSCG